MPDDIKREKCHFFQDLLLSTLTEQKLTMKVSGMSLLSFPLPLHCWRQSFCLNTAEVCLSVLIGLI